MAGAVVLFFLLWSALILGVMHFYRKQNVDVGKEYYNIDPKKSGIYEKE